MEARRSGRLLTQHDWVAGENGGEAVAESILEQVVNQYSSVVPFTRPPWRMNRKGDDRKC